MPRVILLGIRNVDLKQCSNRTLIVCITIIMYMKFTIWWCILAYKVFFTDVPAGSPNKVDSGIGW